MFVQPVVNITLEELHRLVSPDQVLYYYTGYTPSNKLILSPFRDDSHPSFKINYYQGNLRYHDFGSGDDGDYIDFCVKITGMSRQDIIQDSLHNIVNINKHPKIPVIMSESHTQQQQNPHHQHSQVDIQIRTRSWNKSDESYWGQFGIPIGLLDVCRVLPIDYYWVNGICFTADKLAYDYIEYKDNIMTHKIYQPLIKDHSRKWLSTHTSDVISLWTQLDAESDIVVLAASLKDALTIKANLGINVIALQGEGYIPSKTVINQLRQRFKRQIIIYDNDEPGIKYSTELADKTKFENVILPKFDGGKDIAEMIVAMGKNKFKETLSKLLNL